MRRWIAASLFLFASFCYRQTEVASLCYGQTEVEVIKYQEIVGSKDAVVLGGRLFVAGVDTQLASRECAVVKVQSASEIRVDGSDVDRKTVPVTQLETNVWLVTAPGKTWLDIREYIEIEIAGVKRKLLSDSRLVVVELGRPVPPPVPPGPGPTPPTPPTPVTGCESKTNTAFSSLARRSCEWVSDVAAGGRIKRSDLSKAYKETADKLATGEHLTINAASVAMRDKWNTILGTDEMKQAWSAWSGKANEELTKHWQDQSTNTAKRELLVEFYRSLSEGLAP